MATGTTTRIYELQVKLARDSLQQLKLLQGHAKKVDENLAGVINTAKGVALAFASGQFLGAVIQNTVDAEKAAAQLDATLKSTGRYTPELSQAMRDYSNSLQEVTAFEDDAITSAQGMLLKYTQIGGDIFPAATEAAMDMATALSTDLNSAVTRIGKALNDPVKGMAALTKAGVTFSDAQKDVIENMVKTGDIVGAQELMLKQLEIAFGGSAEAAKTTLGGALASLQNTIGNLLEGDTGSVEGLVAGVNDLNKSLNDPRVLEAMQKITTAVLNLMTAVVKALPELTGFTDWAAESLAAAFYGPAADDIVRLEEHLAALEKRATTLQRLGHVIPEDLHADMAKYNQLILDYWENASKAADAPPIIAPEVPALIITTGTEVKKTTAEIKKYNRELEQAQKTALEMSAGEEYINKVRADGVALTKEMRTAYEVLQDDLAAYTELLNRGVISQETFNRAVWASSETYTKAGEEADKTDTILAGLASRMDGYSSSISDTFIDFATGADDASQSFSDMAESILADIAKMITQMLVMKPIMDSIGTYFGFAGAAADGRVVDHGAFTPFANGGVVTGPTLFPMASGTGLMGEAGPEAIMPLSRLPSGKLGVESSGGGGAVVVNVFNESGAEVTTETNTGPNGEQVIDIMIQKSVNKAIGQGVFDSTLQTTYGLQRRGN